MDFRPPLPQSTLSCPATLPSSDSPPPAKSPSAPSSALHTTPPAPPESRHFASATPAPTGSPTHKQSPSSAFGPANTQQLPLPGLGWTELKTHPAPPRSLKTHRFRAICSNLETPSHEVRLTWS